MHFSFPLAWMASTFVINHAVRMPTNSLEMSSLLSKSSGILQSLAINSDFLVQLNF